MQVSGDPTSQLGCVCFEPGGSPPGPRFPRGCSAISGDSFGCQLGGRREVLLASGR